MLTAFRFFRTERWLPPICRNPLCGDWLPVKRRRQRWELCPSCRLAYRRGATIAAVLAFVVEVISRWIR